jgi:hypothetical protein
MRIALLVAALVAIWITVGAVAVTNIRLINYLRENHRDLWREIGSPGSGSLDDWPSLAARARRRSFILFGGYKRTADPLVEAFVRRQQWQTGIGLSVALVLGLRALFG